jgi:hypothetical protein
MNIATMRSIIELDERVAEATKPFRNHSVAATIHDPELGHIFGEMTLSIADILLVGALARTDVLLNGDSGCGKTFVSSLFCRGLFAKGWHLQKLNPNLDEDVFCSVDMATLRNSRLHEAVEPAEFLSLAATVLDECNRTPPPLTNVLLGLCDGEIQLKCGLKFDVGYAYKDSNGQKAQYHFAIAAVNEGKEFSGIFPMDAALARRLSLTIPLSELRPTPMDTLDMIEMPAKTALPPLNSDASEQLAMASDAVLELPLDPLAKVYIAYLANTGRCPHASANGGFHPADGSQELCNKSKCPIQKNSAAFCPSVGGLCNAVLCSLLKAARGMCALRAARTVRRIRWQCRQGAKSKLAALRTFAGVRKFTRKLPDAVVAKYLKGLRVTVEDIKAILPFFGGGKIWMSKEYVAKNFCGSEWMAMKSYVRETYSRLEDFFRQHQSMLARLSEGQDVIDKLVQRLEHAEQFSDPAIRHTIEPFLARRSSTARPPEDIALEIEANKPVTKAAEELTCR